MELVCACDDICIYIISEFNGEQSSFQFSGQDTFWKATPKNSKAAIHGVLYNMCNQKVWLFTRDSWHSYGCVGDLVG